MFATLRFCLVVLDLLVLATPVEAQGTRILDCPASDVCSVWASGDSSVAGAGSVAHAKRANRDELEPPLVSIE